MGEKYGAGKKRVPRDVAKHIQRALVESLDEILAAFTKKAKTGNSSAHVRLFFELLEPVKKKKRGPMEALLANLQKRRAKKHAAKVSSSDAMRS